MPRSEVMGADSVPGNIAGKALGQVRVQKERAQQQRTNGMAKKTGFPLNPFAAGSRVRTRWLPEIAGHLQPVFARLAKELRILERAREEGVHNRPAPGDTTPDETQRAIVGRVTEGANMLSQFLSNQLVLAHARIAERMPERLDPELALASVHGEKAEVRVKMEEGLVEARLNERLARRHLSKFMRDHALDRDAHYAENGLAPFATAFVLLTIETLANGGLFAGASPLGWSGGILQALLFGSVNVILGLCTGCFAVRQLWHVQPLRRVLGAVMTTIMVSMGIVLAFAVAHYRQSLAADPDAAMFAIQRLGSPSDWMHITSIESLILLILSLVIFLLAIAKGTGGRGGFTDKYWGYKPAHQAYRETDDAYAGLKAQFRAALHGATIKAGDSLRRTHNANEVAVREIREIAAQARQRQEEVIDSVGEWNAMGEALIARYREENEKVRTVSVPAYFHAGSGLTACTIDPDGIAPITACVDDAASLHKANADALAHALHMIADLLEREANTFLAEIAAVDERADRRLRELDQAAGQAAPAEPDETLHVEPEPFREAAE